MDRLSSSKKVVGIKQTKNAIKGNNAKCVYVANDADPSLTEQVFALCKEYNVEAVAEFSRKEIAKACRVDVPCTTAAIIK